MNMEDTVPAMPACEAEPVIVRLAGVRKTYKDTVAVDHVDLSVHRGEFFTMLGAWV